MSAIQTRYCQIRWGYLVMIPWYRQVLALVFGLGVMLIALWGIEQGSGPWMIASVAGMAFMTLLLIFGVEVDSIQVGDKLEIDFTSTSTTETVTEDESKDDD